MHQHDVDLHAALQLAAEMHAERSRHALDELYPAVLTLGVSPEVYAALKFYVAGLMNWPRGNDSWTFESQRYFGKDGLRVQAERVVELYPKKRVLDPRK